MEIVHDAAQLDTYISEAVVVSGTSNAVNLTDGLDGLAIMPSVFVAAALGIFAYVAGHTQIADYLHVRHIAFAGEISVVCGTLAGAGLGFLWFNAYPAQVFMGDVGALSLGAALGVVAVLLLYRSLRGRKRRRTRPAYG